MASAANPILNAASERALKRIAKLAKQICESPCMMGDYDIRRIVKISNIADAELIRIWKENADAR